ncbi:MAG TPA: energy-coupling factor transporter transmembrane component T, partial [Syntrophales bacterium]|nr:energy-coupling factor transporter transmembrane component T [Syntrophales bacterium]
GPLIVSSEGIDYMVALTLRSNAIMLALIAFVASTTITSMAHAMTALKVPDKITYLFFLTYRYIGDIYNEYTRLVNAMRVRCFKPASTLHTYRSYAYLVGVLLVNSFERAQRIRAAMLCRGFNGRFPRIEEKNFSRLDILSLIVLCVVLAGIIYVNG